MKPDLQANYILVTGAGRGLGRHLALHLSSCGAILGIADVDPESIAETAASVSAQGGEVHPYVCDVGSQEDFATMCADFSKQGGRIDAIVNNAMLLRYGPVESVDNELLSSMLDVGIKPLFWAAQALKTYLDPQRGAVMINMASPVSHRGYPLTSAYTACKTAIVGVTRVLAAELGPLNIRTNCVSPASVPTPGSLGLNTADVYEKRKLSIPLRRLGTEEDNSNAIAILLSREMSFVNGEVFNIDGGVAATM